jgi:outer membrane protein assembly factor BamB
VSRLRTTTIPIKVAIVLASLAPAFTSGAPEETVQKVPSEVRWSVALSAPPASPASISDSRIFVALKSGIVAAHSAADGGELWRRDLRTELPIDAVGDRLFVVSGDAIHALDADSGTSVWTAPAGTVTAPLLVQDGWIIAAVAGELSAYRAADGSKVWSHPSGAQTERATIEGDRLYVPLKDRVMALELATGDMKWERQISGEPTEVLAFADRVYVGSLDKFFYCLRADGGELDWAPVRVGAAVRGKPAADAAHVYITALDNLIRAFDRKNGALRWRMDAGFRPKAGPTVIGSAVVVGGPAAELQILSAATGRRAGPVKLSQTLLLPPAFHQSKGWIVMAALTGDLTEKWMLTLTEPPLWPSMTVVPLTELPGVVVPIQPPG